MSNNNKRSFRKNSLSSDKVNETLKGRIRELVKEAEKWKRYALSLEKKLNISPEKLEDIKAEKKRKKEQSAAEKPTPEGCLCSNCGSTNTEKKRLWTPSGEKTFLHCDDCKHKEKIDDAR